MAKKDYMKISKMLGNADYRQVRKFLVIVLVGFTGILGLLFTIDYTQNKIGNYIYSQTAEPFLAYNR